jgi:predicted nucleic acid-binding protein
VTAVVADTGVFGASLSRRRQSIAHLYEKHLSGRQLVIATQTVAEMRYGALVAGWGESQLAELQRRIALARIAVIDDAMIWSHARLRAECRAAGHALSQPSHASDLWVAATAAHFEIPIVTHDNVFLNAPRLTVISEAQPTQST